MKKITLFLLILSSMISFGQSECPTTIKTSGQSSPDNPIFTVPNGNNGCSAGWPATITVDGTLTYSYVGCTGGNLEYILDPISQTPPDTFEMTIDFGNGLVCSYDASGAPIILSNVEFSEDINKLSIYPNPIYSSDIMNFEFSRDMSFKIRLFDLVGKVVFSKSYFEVQKASTRFSKLDSGMYIVRIETQELIITRKIIIKK